MPRMKGFGRNVPRRSTPRAAQANVDGAEVHVDGDAVRTWNTAAADEDSGLTEVKSAWDVRNLRATIGADGIRQAAADAGRRPPSDRTIRRWVANNRIPHSEVAERVQRRTLVTSQGGVDEFATKMGLSPSAIRRYQRGQTSTFRQQRHRRGAEKEKAAATLAQAGIADHDGNLLKSPRITLKGAFEYRANGKTSGDYRSSREFDIGGMDDTDAKDFADAVARDDAAAAIAVIERHLTTDYATSFDGFDDDTGFHMTHVSDVHIDWD